MSALPQPQSNDEPEHLPISPEIIRDIQGLPRGFSASQKRFHARLVSNLIEDHKVGCIVTVVERDGSVKIFEVKQFIIGPTE